MHPIGLSMHPIGLPRFASLFQIIMIIAKCLVHIVAFQNLCVEAGPNPNSAAYPNCQPVVQSQPQRPSQRQPVQFAASLRQQTALVVAEEVISSGARGLPTGMCQGGAIPLMGGGICHELVLLDLKGVINWIDYCVHSGASAQGFMPNALQAPQFGQQPGVVGQHRSGHGFGQHRSGFRQGGVQQFAVSPGVSPADNVSSNNVQQTQTFGFAGRSVPQAQVQGIQVPSQRGPCPSCAPACPSCAPAGGAPPLVPINNVRTSEDEAGIVPAAINKPPTQSCAPAGGDHLPSAPVAVPITKETYCYRGEKPTLENDPYFEYRECECPCGQGVMRLSPWGKKSVEILRLNFTFYKVLRGKAVMKLHKSENAQETKREIEILTQLRLHPQPGLIPVYQIGRKDPDGFWYSIHPRYDASLQQAGWPHLQHGQIFKVLCGIAQALRILAERKLVHRDVKPDNVLVNWSGKEISDVRLIDFGIAGAVGEQKMQFIYRTDLDLQYRYFMPELYDTHSTRRSTSSDEDVWALGVLVVEGITGLCFTKVFPADIGRILHDGKDAFIKRMQKELGGRKSPEWQTFRAQMNTRLVQYVFQAVFEPNEGKRATIHELQEALHLGLG